MASRAQRLLSYFFASWHLRRMPPGATEEARRERRIWCRDHCTTFAGRWFAVAAVLLLVQSLPIPLLQLGGWLAPLMGIGTVVAFLFGLWHLVWQIVAQSRVGPPPIEPPVEIRPQDERQRYGKRF